MCYLQNSYIQNQNDTENFKIKGYKKLSALYLKKIQVKSFKKDRGIFYI